jgi:endoglucanase
MHLSPISWAKALLTATILTTALPAISLAQIPTSTAVGPDAQHNVSGSRESQVVQEQIRSFNSLVGTWPRYIEISAQDQVAAMGPGINIIGGYDPYWTGEKTTFTDADIKRVKEAGFKTIRVPLFTFKHIADTQGHLDPKWLDRLDHIIDLAVKNKLTVILDEHDFEDCAKDVDACAVLLPNIWYDLSERYKDAPSSVVFELLNEPNGNVDAKIWNTWVPDLISIVRETNPTRNIIIGPVMWNSADQLENLKLPATDRHLIATFHYYTPMEFTHQGASWAGPDLEKLRGVHWTGTAEQQAAIDTTFDKVTAWSKANNRPIFLGEYGTYGKFNDQIDDRAAWTRAVSKAADDRGFARAYWYYQDGGGFGVWDAEKGQWVKPLLKALLPNSPAAQ